MLFDNPSDAVWVLDLHNLRFLYVSDEIKSILGYLPAEVEKLSPADICTPSCAKQAMATLEMEVAKLKQGKHATVKLITEFIKKDGSTVTAGIDWRLLEEDGQVKAIGILRDPKQGRAAHKIEDELDKQLRDLLEERDRLRWEVKILQGLLPICSNCKKIRDEEGDWLSLEDYVLSHSEAEFTHTICPPCKNELYPFLK